MRRDEEKGHDLTSSEAGSECRGEDHGGQRRQGSGAAAPDGQSEAGGDQALGEGDLRMA